MTASQAHSASPARRLAGVDALRVLAALCVVYLHAKPFMLPAYADSGYAVVRDAILQFARFAVPFFFIAAGFFLGKKLFISANPLAGVHPYLARLITIYTVWTLFYLAFPINWLELLLRGDLRPFVWKAANALELAAHHPLAFLFKSTSVHLWFLPALALASLLLALAIRFRQLGIFLALGAGLYGAGLASDAYQPTPWGHRLGLDIAPPLVLGLLYPSLFVGLGGWLSQHDRYPAGLGWGLAIGGLLLQVAESLVLHQAYGTPLAAAGYLVGTVPFSAGLMMLGLSCRCGSSPRVLNALAGATLGIYLLHVWVKGLLFPLDRFLGGPLWELGFAPLIFLLAWAGVALVKRTRLGALVT